MNVEGKVVLVTGASSGIGLAAARALARAGAKLALGARSVDVLERECAVLTAAGSDAIPVRLDVPDDNAVASAMAAVLEQLGRIDIAINVAGNGGTLDL